MKSERRQLVEIYREAAAQMEEFHEEGSWEYSCNHIKFAMDEGHYSDTLDAIGAYERIYRPDSGRPGGFAWGESGKRETSWNNRERIVALCLAAAMTEAGDAP